MRLPPALALLSIIAIAWVIVGCRRTRYTPPESPLPPNTILLSQMMRELSAQPGFTEALLKELGAAGGAKAGDKKKQGPALMTPRLIDDLRQRILGKDWSGLDRFPGWSMRRINPTVRVVGHYAGKDEKLEATSEVHPGASPSAAAVHDELDLGPYALDKAETISLGKPSTLPPFTTEGLVTELGDGVTRGDGPNIYAPEHAESQRLADVLNRLAVNKLDAVKKTQVVLSLTTNQEADPHKALYDPHMGGSVNARVHIDRPESLIFALIDAGHTVTVDDARYFANFGHLHYKGQDVMMPFWVDTGYLVPNTGGRRLLIPVAHAELEWHIRGPRINADISYYFGVDGKSEWRTIDTLDQSWVLRRAAHTWTGAQAVEATRLASLLTVAYMHQHAARPKIPFGGYYALGVCQDGVSAIEHALTGHVTLFPNTVDAALFNDPRDAEINALMRAIPKDRDGSAPDPARIFGSLPADPGPNGDFPTITIPGLRNDLTAAYAAWKQGKLHRRLPWPLFIFTGN
jgi:hypothetical protein